MNQQQFLSQRHDYRVGVDRSYDMRVLQSLDYRQDDLTIPRAQRDILYRRCGFVILSEIQTRKLP